MTQVRRTIVFFFQAEDGIRDYKVTGVQTCALPISQVDLAAHPRKAHHRLHRPLGLRQVDAHPLSQPARSEERRVGKAWRSRWSPAGLMALTKDARTPLRRRRRSERAGRRGAAAAQG